MLLFNKILKYNMFIIALLKNGILFRYRLGLVNGPDSGIWAPVFWPPSRCLPILRESFVSFWTSTNTSSLEARPFRKKFVPDTLSVKARVRARTLRGN